MLKRIVTPTCRGLSAASMDPADKPRDVGYKKILAFFACSLFFPQAHAFPCYFTAMKDTCWKEYEVTLTVTDVSSKKSLFSITIPKGKLWARQAFSCEPGQKILYSATFQPTIWQGHEHKVYQAQHFWSLPDKVSSKHKAWDIPVCFPEAFAEVPMPPTAGSHCVCEPISQPPPPTK